jgi:transposase-like protein
MNPEAQFCPNSSCHASGQEGLSNIRVHSRKKGRYKCTCCGKTFSERRGTAVYQLKKPVDLFVIIVTLLVNGCPPQAIVAAYGLDWRTVASWQKRAGNHARQVHEQVIGQSHLDLGQVQADEIKVKTQRGYLWLALAIMVSTRLWIAGAVSPHRDKALIRRLANQVRQVAQYQPLLIAVDGLASYIKAFRLAFRTKVHTGKRGAPCKIPWPDLMIVQVVKRHSADVFTIERRIVQGCAEMVQSLIDNSQGIGGGINTAFIERFNATFRQRLGFLARRTRALARRLQTVESGMYLLGSVYNFCTFHNSLSVQIAVGYTAKHWVKRTPAMAAGLTDHRWTIYELLHFKVPSRFAPPKKRGRPPKFRCSCGFSSPHYSV